MKSVKAPKALQVALLGFGDFERSALVSYLRLSASRVPAYVEASSLASADYVVADADHTGTLDTVLGADRVADTVFIGSLAPDGALAWMMRPIDPLQVIREIDAAVTLRQAQAQDHMAPPAAPRASAPAPAPAPASAPAPAPDAPTPAASTAATAATAATGAPAAGPPATGRTAPARGRSAARAGDTSAPTAALLVDDSEIALRFLERQLQALGLRTDTAATSERALELLARHRYDVVFLDVELGPQSALDGLALCQRIKNPQGQAAKAAVPLVVMVTAHAGATDRTRGSFAGCDAYLAKPINDEAMRRSLRKLGLRLSATESGFGSSRPGALSSRLQPLDDPK